MELTKTTLGDFELYTILAGDIKLDGGAMFGVVPKTLWSKGIKADEKNRIQMTMRCLLIKSNKTGRVYLIDNGAGDKFDEKMTSIYGLDYSNHTLSASLQYHGFTFDNVTDMIFTHLHFDHCGGTTSFDNEDLVFNFRNATHYIHKDQWKTATKPNAREKASFLKENMQPMKSSDQIRLIDDDHIFEPGLSVLVMNGHTRGQILPKIEADGKTIVYAADLLPTHVHIPLAWVMGYDMYPIQTLEEKKAFLESAANKNWYLYLEHDYYKEVVQLKKEDKKYKVGNTLTLSDL